MRMRLFSAIRDVLAADGLDIARVHYTVIDGRGGYFQNVRRLVEFSSERVVLAGRKGRVYVEGEGLRLGRCGEGDVTVLGDIVRVGREA